MKKIKFLAFCAISVCFSSLTSCMNQDLSITDDSYFTAIALSSNECEPAITTVDSLINAFKSTTSQQNSAMQKVAAISGPAVYLLSDMGAYPIKMVIDFGTNGFSSTNAITYKGKVNVIIDDIAGRKKTYSFYDFSINDNKIEGLRIVEILKHGENSVLKITTEENVVYSDKKTSTRSSIRIRTKIDDNDTPDNYTDDSFEFTGSTKGINTNGIAYEVEITKALITASNFKYFISGEIKTTTVKGIQMLNFGNGEQDDLAISRINNGNAKELKLNW